MTLVSLLDEGQPQSNVAKHLYTSTECRETFVQEYRMYALHEGTLKAIRSDTTTF